jgi:hypothetical protein
VYKVGYSTTFYKRLQGYPKSYSVVLAVRVEKGTGRRAEQLVLDSFRHRFKRRRDFGAEYFEGKDADMLVTIASIASRFRGRVSKEEDTEPCSPDTRFGAECDTSMEIDTDDNAEVGADDNNVDVADTVAEVPVAIAEAPVAIAEAPLKKNKKDPMQIVLDYAEPIIRGRRSIPIAEFYDNLQIACSASGLSTPPLEAVSKHLKKMFGGIIVNIDFVFKNMKVEGVKEVCANLRTFLDDGPIKYVYNKTDFTRVSVIHTMGSVTSTGVFKDIYMNYYKSTNTDTTRMQFDDSAMRTFEEFGYAISKVQMCKQCGKKARGGVGKCCPEYCPANRIKHAMVVNMETVLEFHNGNGTWVRC